MDLIENLFHLEDCSVKNEINQIMKNIKKKFEEKKMPQKRLFKQIQIPHTCIWGNQEIGRKKPHLRLSEKKSYHKKSQQKNTISHIFMSQNTMSMIFCHKKTFFPYNYITKYFFSPPPRQT
jgi:hypothetical protein